MGCIMNIASGSLVITLMLGTTSVLCGCMADAGEDEAGRAELVAAAPQALTSLRSEDLIFDYLEHEYQGYWPPHQASYVSGSYYERYYSNGQYLLSWNGNLWYTIAGVWYQNSTIQAWY